MVLAGIDIGTLTCRLLIAEVAPPAHLRELTSDRKVLRLGEGLARTHRLSDGAIARVIDTLTDWRAVIDRATVDGQVVAATSAVREAENGAELVGRIKAVVGYDVEILSGPDEARLAMRGIRAGLPADLEAVVGVDIGGGSTELMVHRAGQPLEVRSVNLGAVTLTEALLLHDPPTAAEIEGARDRIRSSVEPIRGLLGETRGITMVGTAGTITTLAAMAQALTVYDPMRIHDYLLSLEVVRDLERRLLQRTSDQRRELAGLEPGREDVIGAGTLILRGIMETFGWTVCRVSEFGLREGLVLELAERLAKGKSKN